MYLIAATFLVLLVLALMDLLEKKMNGATISSRSWLMAFVVPTIISGVIFAVYWWLEANPKIAHTPLPSWFGFGLGGLLVGGFFFASVLEKYHYKEESDTESSVMLAGMVSVFISGGLWLKFGFSTWLLPVVIPFVWIVFGGLWSGSVALVVWFAEQVFRRKTLKK
jgi:hypothetical protein